MASTVTELNAQATKVEQGGKCLECKKELKPIFWFVIDQAEGIRRAFCNEECADRYKEK